MGYSNTSKGRGVKGSKYWIQTVVEEEELRRALESELGEALEWLSPLAGEENTYDEYELRDGYVCERLGLSWADAESFFAFWPKRQPQWDALALGGEGTVLYLFEAKAHVTELESKCAATNAYSKELIIKSMNEVKEKYFARGDFEAWLNKYYQLGNRLTFLRKLGEKPFGKISAVKLVLLNFVNDNTYIPTPKEEWEGHYKSVLAEMTGGESAPEDVIIINYDVGNLK